ncbi:MAG TPA: hypothetical protein VMU33_19580 [Burkholderiaceae bacterium]|nr:hypothetical protein [Burkholderiaceae bacterium]
MIEYRAIMKAINLNRLDMVSLRRIVANVEAGSLTIGADRFAIRVAAASKRMAELEALSSAAREFIDPVERDVALRDE